MMLFQTTNNHADVNAITNNTQPNIPTSLFSFITPLEDSISQNEGAMATTCDMIPVLQTSSLNNHQAPGHLSAAEGKNKHNYGALPSNTAPPIVGSGGSKKRKQMAPLRLQHNKNVKGSEEATSKELGSSYNGNNPMGYDKFLPNKILSSHLAPSHSNVEAYASAAPPDERFNFQYHDASKEDVVHNVHSGYENISQNFIGQHFFKSRPLVGDRVEAAGKEDEPHTQINETSSKSTNKMRENASAVSSKLSPPFQMDPNTTITITSPLSIPPFPTLSSQAVASIDAAPMPAKNADLINKYSNLNFPYFGPPPPAYFQYFLQDHYLQAKGDNKHSGHTKLNEGGANYDKHGDVSASTDGLKINLAAGIPAYTHPSFPFELPPLFPHHNQPLPPPPSRIFNPEAFCELCNKEFCNKYFLKTHKANKHGVFDMASLNNFYANNLNLFTPGFAAEGLACSITADVSQPANTAVLTDLPKSSSSDPYPKIDQKLEPKSSESSCESLAQTPVTKMSDYYNFSQFPFPNFLNAYSSFFPPPKLPPTLPSNPSNTGPPSFDTTINDDATISTPQMKDTKSSPTNDCPQQLNEADLMSQIADKSQTADAYPHNEPSMMFKSYSTSPLQMASLTNERSETRFSSTAESYCDICRKEFCNKYFLRKHKKNIHGIVPSESSGLPNGSKGASISCNSDGSSPNHSSFDAGCDAAYLDLHKTKPSQEGAPNLKYYKPEMANELTGLPTPANYSDKHLSYKLYGEKNECSTCRKVFSNQHFLRSHMYNVHEQDSSMLAHVKSSPTSNIETDENSKNYKSNYDEISKWKISRSTAPTEPPFATENDDQVRCMMSSESLGLVQNNDGKSSSNPSKKSSFKPNESFNHAYNNVPLPQSFKDRAIRDPEPSSKNKASASLKEESMKEYEFAADYPRLPKRDDDCYCDICNKEFSTKYFLRTHKLNAHNISNITDGVASEINSYPPMAPPLDAKVANKPIFMPRINADNVGTSEMKGRDPYYMGRGASSLQHFSQWGSSFCQICQKELCNKYFLKTHMIKMHGISVDDAKQMVKRNSGYTPSPMVNNLPNKGLTQSPPNWSPPASFGSENALKSRKPDDSKTANFYKGMNAKDRLKEGMDSFSPFPPISSQYTDNGPMEPFNPMLYNPYYPYYFSAAFGAPMHPYANPNSPFLTPTHPYFFDGCDPGLNPMMEYGTNSNLPYKFDSSHLFLKSHGSMAGSKDKLTENIKVSITNTNSSTPFACPYCGVLNHNPKALATHVMQEHHNATGALLRPGGNASKTSQARFSQFYGKKEFHQRQRRRVTGSNKYSPISLLARYYKMFNSKRLDYYAGRKRMMKRCFNKSSPKFVSKKLMAHKRLYFKDSDFNKRLRYAQSIVGKTLFPLKQNLTNDGMKTTHLSLYDENLTNTLAKICDGQKLSPYPDFTSRFDGKLGEADESYVMQTFRLMPVDFMSSGDTDKAKASPHMLASLDHKLFLKQRKEDFPLISTIVNLPMARKVKDKVIAVLCMEPLEYE